MKVVMEHCDEKRHEALRRQVAWSIVMTRALRIVMRRVLEHCGDKYMEGCDYMGHGAFDDKVMDHCNDKGHGTLC